MQALRHLDKQFIVPPVFMLAINSVCYSIAAHGKHGQATLYEWLTINLNANYPIASAIC